MPGIGVDPWAGLDGLLLSEQTSRDCTVLLGQLGGEDVEVAVRAVEERGPSVEGAARTDRARSRAQTRMRTRVLAGLATAVRACNEQ